MENKSINAALANARQTVRLLAELKQIKELIYEQFKVLYRPTLNVASVLVPKSSSQNAPVRTLRVRVAAKSDIDLMEVETGILRRPSSDPTAVVRVKGERGHTVFMRLTKDPKTNESYWRASVLYPNTESYNDQEFLIKALSHTLRGIEHPVRFDQEMLLDVSVLPVSWVSDMISQ